MFDLFRDPPPEYRPVLVWTPSHSPPEIELTHLMAEVRSKGFGAVVLQTDCDAIQNGPPTGTERESSEHARLFTIPSLPLDGNVVRWGSAERTDASLSSAVCAERCFDPAVGFGEPRDEAISKLLISNAHLRGRSRVPALIEVTPGVSLADLKSRADWLAASGANLFCPALIGKNGNCVPKPWKQPSWRHFGLLADYLARLSWMLSQGPHRAQAALLHPISGFIYERSQGVESTLDRVILEFFHAYCELLRNEHIDFDILTEDSLARACCSDQTLNISGEEYELLVIPPTTCLGVKAARAVREFVDDGGALLGSVMLPCRDVDYAHSEVRTIFESVFGLNPEDTRTRARTAGCSEEPFVARPGERVAFLHASSAEQLSSILRECITSLIKPRVSLRRGGCECHDISFTQRLTHDGELFFFANVSPHPREVRMTIRCDGAPYVLDAETGVISALPYCTQQGDRTILLYRFEGYGSLMLHFLSEPALLPTRAVAEEGIEVELAKEWEFAIEGQNCVPLIDWIHENEPNSKSLHSYTTVVEVAADVGNIYLALATKDVEESSIEINGKEVSIGSRWAFDESYRCLAIPDEVKGSALIVRITSHSCKPGRLRRSPRAFIVGDFRIGRGGRLLRPLRTVQTGPLNEQGYPRAIGLLVYRQMLHLPGLLPGQRSILRAVKPTGTVEFVVNGVSAGVRAWPPYQIDITRFVRPGTNRIEIRVTNDISNLFSAQPCPSGLLGGASVVIV